ncbi:hypothetical protein RHSIM_Rhsim09G0198200 [Rhododendron simsii]|uniref:Cytochrome P450 n=1 Tax=Rhododendron simsii TaxID=118357 RepID=A0A834GCM1_RHOSS|nr:hypothetical protein RHSIM_Rhsim09G0198200 [Rhododendron simsii]
MGFLYLVQALGIATIFFLLFVLWRVLYSCWILPNQAYNKLRRNGFGGPTPNFPLGNIRDMTKKKPTNTSSPSSEISHDIHPTVFPFFANWQKSHGKVFIYWLGTEPFLYIADPEFLKKMSAGVMGKSWGKPTVFKNDREPMFGNGLIMVEGEEWVRHRHAMSSLMVESTTNMLDRWTTLIASGAPEIDVEREITSTAGEIIAKSSFGMGYENGRKVFDKLRAMQLTLFNSNRFVGVPFSKFMSPKQTLAARKLGREIDSLLTEIITARRKSNSLRADDGRGNGFPQSDLLGILLSENRHYIVPTTISLKQFTFLLQMGWVMNEVLRLYSPAPNVQRQAREDIKVDDVIIPNGTNMWIDVVAMHHNQTLWGDDVNEFKPERFRDNLHGGCKHKMGFLPFGFGGRMCVGRNLSMMEYKIVLTLILSRFSFSLSPGYCHSPSIMLSLRPAQGLPLVLQPL